MHPVILNSRNTQAKAKPPKIDGVDEMIVDKKDVMKVIKSRIKK